MEQSTQTNSLSTPIIPKPHLLYARGSHGTLIIIDQHKLKYSHRLEGANIFNMLFKIKKDSPFGEYPFKHDENGYITLLSDLDISATEWNLLIHFINTGIVRGHLKYMDNPSNKLNFMRNLELINDVSTKLGVIPSFTNFYNSIMKDVISRHEHIKNSYNPMNATEDYKHLFQYRAIGSDHSGFIPLSSSLHPSDGWNMIKWETCRQSRDGRQYEIFIYRRRRSHIQDSNANEAGAAPHPTAAEPYPYIVDASGNTIDMYGNLINITNGLQTN